ncbi:hypothetical protein P691DRAFT_706533 [Macrolepiota fuliginosa MF-IS2]|uniref:Nephrocystin 3-like N-terminal domain-containing protein n=1 Tax=Macrolepiota fuliginosa MF-IS2 TaxID=1400762 RepID=A0A9P5XC23_9AGAR|nr:hypothetical protein P691DRAFT_706533 [Macrolepiota fuliginosa MF-IS2]
MPILSNAQGFVINNSQFIDHHTAIVSGGPTGIDILLDASLPDAAHDSSARDPPPRCFPGTREQCIEDVVQWAIPASSDAPLPIFRMKGPAGVGKSAVAQTSVERVAARGKLGAAFFFSTDGRSKPAHFFTTIAYQLSTGYPDYHDLIEKKVRRDKTLVYKALASQFHELIAQPLRELGRSGKGIGRVPIFVDGLDECEDERAQCTIIEIIAASVRDKTLPLCWAFFSRPEPHIEATFAKPDISALCHTMVLPVSHDADGDIELYLRAGFENILRRRGIPMNSPWPSEDNIKLLVKTAGGLFVYVTSALRFIDQTGSLGPEEPLRAVLAAISHGHDATTAPFAELDALYRLILGRIPEEMLPSIRLLLALLCHLSSDSPQNTILIANVLRLSRMEQQTICNRLSAVLRVRDLDGTFDIDPDIDTSRPYLENPNLGIDDLKKLRNSIYGRLGGAISFYHKSFREFLIDPRRSDLFWFKPPAIHELLFEYFYKLRRDYERTYCLRGSVLTLAPHIPDSASSLSYPHTTELVNSIIKAEVYALAGNLCSHLVGTRESDFNLLQKHGNADFRKSLCVISTLNGVRRGHEYLSCYGHQKSVYGTILFRLCPGEFQRFSVVEFKKMIERRQRAGLLRPYSSPFQQEAQDLAESGLYVAGHGSKSVYWYWEINYTEEHYQEFRALDLAEGERIFREERFDLWFKEPG